MSQRLARIIIQPLNCNNEKGNSAGAKFVSVISASVLFSLFGSTFRGKNNGAECLNPKVLHLHRVTFGHARFKKSFLQQEKKRSSRSACFKI